MPVKDLQETGAWSPGSGRMRWKATVSGTPSHSTKMVRRAKNFPHVPGDPTEGRAAAEAWVEETRAEIVAGERVESRKSKHQTVEDVWVEWFDMLQKRGGRSGKGITRSAAANYDGYWRNYLAGMFGDLRIASLSSAHVKDWIEVVANHPRQVTVGKAFKAFKSMCEYAVRKGYASVNPCVDTDTGRNLLIVSTAPVGAGIALTRRQADRLIAFARDWTLLVRLALATGVRWGEVIEIRRKDLMLPVREWGAEAADGLLRVSRSRSNRGEVKPPKNGKVRDLPIPAGLAAELSEEFYDLAPDELVFRGARGGAMPYSAGKVLPVTWEEKRRRGRTGRGKGIVASMNQPPRKDSDTVIRTKREYFGKIVVEAALLVRDVQAALGLPEGSETDHYGNARFGERTAREVFYWKEGRGDSDPDLTSLSPEELSVLLGREVTCDLVLGDADWQRPLDLEPKAQRPDEWDERTFGFHDLRRTAASLALEGGVPPHVVQAILDHASAAFTVERYAEVNEGTRRAVTRALNF